MFAYEWGDLAQGKKVYIFFSYGLKTVLECAKNECLLSGPARKSHIGVRDRIASGRPGFKSWLCTCLLYNLGQFTWIVCILIALFVKWK